MATSATTLKSIFSIIILIFSIFFYYIFRDGTSLPDLPQINWGPNSPLNIEDSKVYPFKINISDNILLSLKSQLKQELNSQRFAPSLEGIGFEYGFNTNYLQKVVQYWHSNYNWRQREELLNQFPHFKTKINGLDLHFQHVKPEVNSKYNETLPLLILHGWPGSFVEHQKIIPFLLAPSSSNFNFEVVIPSLPGFGFSDTSVRPGLGLAEMARLFLKLMERLGHSKFYVQGGDWGAIIVTHMATLYPENVLALHSNLCVSLHPRGILRLLIAAISPSFFMSTNEMERLIPYSDRLSFVVRESGYFHLQATKPDTIGVALSLSPSGLAAYILEKFSTGTNVNGVHSPDGLLDSSGFTMDELLDNVMVYWVTKTATSSARVYLEALSARELGYGLDRIPVQVPTACFHSKDPYVMQSEWILRDKFPNLVHYKMINEGGHFLSMEKPHLLANSLLEFVGQLNNL